MFIKKMATNIFVYYWSDGLEGNAFDFDHHNRNGGGEFAYKNCPLGRAIDQCFSNAWGLPGGGMLATGFIYGWASILWYVLCMSYVAKGNSDNSHAVLFHRLGTIIY